MSQQAAEAKDAAKAAVFERLKTKLLDDHPGFSRDLLEYDPKTDAWTKAGEFPTGSHVTTTAVKWDGSIVVPSGEIRPGVRSPKVWRSLPRGEK